MWRRPSRRASSRRPSSSPRCTLQRTIGYVVTAGNRECRTRLRTSPPRASGLLQLAKISALAMSVLAMSEPADSTAGKFDSDVTHVDGAFRLSKTLGSGATAVWQPMMRSCWRSRGRTSSRRTSTRCWPRAAVCASVRRGPAVTPESASHVKGRRPCGSVQCRSMSMPSCGLQERQPHVLLTTTYKPSKVMFHFLADMLDVSHLTLCHPPCPSSPCTSAHCRKT